MDLNRNLLSSMRETLKSMLEEDREGAAAARERRRQKDEENRQRRIENNQKKKEQKQERAEIRAEVDARVAAANLGPNATRKQEIEARNDAIRELQQDKAFREKAVAAGLQFGKGSGLLGTRSATPDPKPRVTEAQKAVAAQNREAIAAAREQDAAGPQVDAGRAAAFARQREAIGRQTGMATTSAEQRLKAAGALNPDGSIATRDQHGPLTFSAALADAKAKTRQMEDEMRAQEERAQAIRATPGYREEMNNLGAPRPPAAGRNVTQPQPLQKPKYPPGPLRP